MVTNAAEHSFAISPEVFTSAVALDAYLADVRERRRRRRAEREERVRLQTAIGKVEAELQAAHEDEDAEIAGELEGVLAEFKRRLAEITSPSGDHESQGAFSPMEPCVAIVEDRYSVVLNTQAPGVEGPSTDLTSASPAPPVHSQEECQAIAQPILAEIEKLAVRWHAMDADGLAGQDGALLRPRGFRLRALLGELGHLYARAREDGVADLVKTEIISLRDRIDLARNYAGDAHPCLPCEEDAWTSEDRALSSADWLALRERYARAADADDAFEWYSENTTSPNLSLLNSIAAAQQLLFRELERLVGEDKLQVCFYGDLREAAREAGFLTALCPEIRSDTLDNLAAGLPDLLSAAKRERALAAERRAKLVRKQAAIQSVVLWHDDISERGVPLRQIMEQVDRVKELLDECHAAGVPPTNPEVRSALLEYGPALLAGDPKYARLLDAIQSERRRQGLDEPEYPEPVEEEEPTDAQREEYRHIVAAFVKGLRLLILGGNPRQRTCDELMEALDGAEVKWLASKRSDKAGKFQAEINRANILLLVKNFAGHDMSEKGREWMKAKGGHFVLLPSGYGVNQIIHQLYRHINAKNGRV